MRHAKKLQIRYRAVDDLKPFPNNPRLHSRQQMAQIARSIEEFGFNIPVIVDADDTVICGHGRILAAKRLGWNEMPVACLDHLSQSQVLAFRIADNKLTENARWDDGLLAENLREISIASPDLDLEITGFETPEIDLLLGEVPKAASGPDPADAIPPISDKLAICRSNDIWILGRHRLFCGNARDPSAFSHLMNGRLADAVFVDPPYNVSVTRHVGGLGAIRHREFAMASGEMSPGQFTTFLTDVCWLLARFSKAGSIAFICMDWRHSAELLKATSEVYGPPKNCCVWVKDNGGMGSFYRSQHEFVHVFKKGRAPHRNNVELGRFGRNRSNVWTYPGVNSFSRKSEEGNLLTMHPTSKPVALVADAILDCTARGEVVVDAFIGSGSTLMAAEGTGRCCYGIEIDPLYCDQTIRRWQTYCGEKAIHGETGLCFEESVASGRPIMPRDNKRDYKVGRGKPPLQTRFKPGRSGNPNGGPKGRRGLSALLREELQTSINVTEEGQTKRMTKEQAIVKRFVNALLKGDAKLLALFARLIHPEEERESSAAAERPLSDREKQLLADFTAAASGKRRR